MALGIKNRPITSVAGQKTGFSNKAYFAYTTEFDEIAAPTVTTTEANKREIVTDHTFTGSKGFAEVYTLPDSGSMTSETFGEVGALNSMQKVSVLIPGEGSDVLAMIEEMKNKEMIFLGRDMNNNLIQLGDELAPAYMVPGAPKFESGTAYGGKKGYVIELQALNKWYYSGTVTKMA
jgi:hypothetical protein